MSRYINNLWYSPFNYIRENVAMLLFRALNYCIISSKVNFFSVISAGSDSGVYSVWSANEAGV